MKKLLVLIALLASTVAFAAGQLPVFNATLTIGKEHRFVLVGGDGKASSWLQLGDTFAGYKLKAYDAKASALDLERDGKVDRVTLVSDASVKAGALATTAATLADAEAVMNKMHFEEMIGRILDQQKNAMGKMVDQMAARMNIPATDRDDVLAFQKKVMNEVMSSLNVDQMKTDMTRIYSEVFSKEELTDMAAFYSTPLGETITSKQPAVQQKLQEAMMPRMAEMMPKIQQLGREFAMQQQAKKKAAAAAAAAAAAPAEAPTP
jgi:uncharacterized protein